MPSTTTHVTSVPLCQICFVHPAYADARIPGSSWAYVCGICFLDLGCSLGLGRGQELILASATALDDQCQARNPRGGGRCQREAIDGRVCAHHSEWIEPRS